MEIKMAVTKIKSADSKAKVCLEVGFIWNVSDVLADGNSGVLGVTKIFQMMQPITRSQFNIIHFDWSKILATPIIMTSRFSKKFI